MGQYVNKIGEDQYVVFSTYTDSPIAIGARDEIEEYLLEQAIARATEQANRHVPEAMDLADERLTSSRIGAPPKTYEEALDEMVESYNLNRKDKLTREGFLAMMEAWEEQ